MAILDNATADSILDRTDGWPSPFDTSGLQYAWDSTSLNWAETCLRLYQYSMLERWENPRKSVHLIFGGHYATGLERYHKLRANGLSLDEALFEVIKLAMLETHGWESDHASKNRYTLIRSLVWYVDYFRDDSMETVVLSNGAAAAELSFRFELSRDILYCGHMDRLVQYSGDYYVQDQKTTNSTLSPAYFEKYNPHTQMTGYAYASQIIYAMPVKGVVIDAAQIAVGFTRFVRGFTFRTPKQLDEWRTDSLWHIAQAREATKRYIQGEDMPQNRSSCDKYGGCPFRVVCSRSPEVRPQFLKAEFTRRDGWNPLAAR